MNSKTAVALAIAVAISGVASPAFAYANHHRTRGTRAYDYVPQASQSASPSAGVSRWDPQMTGGGNLGYNQHNEVKN
jgi:hypothetical protein